MRKRLMTLADEQCLQEAQARIDRAEAEKKAAIAARNDLYRELYADQVGVTEMARATKQHRTVVQRIVTPPLSARTS